MAKLRAILLSLLLLSGVALAQSTGGGSSKDDQKGGTLRILSGGKTVATLTVPSGKMNIRADKFGQSQTKQGTIFTASGKVSITFTLDGQTTMQLDAEEIVIERRETAPPAAPVKP